MVSRVLSVMPNSSASSDAPGANIVAARFLCVCQFTISIKGYHYFRYHIRCQGENADNSHMKVLARRGPVERVSRVIGAIPIDHVGVFELDRLDEFGVFDIR